MPSLVDIAKIGVHSQSDDLLDFAVARMGPLQRFLQALAGVFLHFVRRMIFRLDQDSQAARMPDHDVGLLAVAFVDHSGLLGLNASFLAPLGMHGPQGFANFVIGGRLADPASILIVPFHDALLSLLVVPATLADLEVSTLRLRADFGFGLEAFLSRFGRRAWFDIPFAAMSSL